MGVRLVIVGAGGFGRDVLEWARLSPRFLARSGVTSFAFLDDGQTGSVSGVPVIGTVASYQPLPSDQLLCAIADPQIRRRLVTQLRGKGAAFTQFVSDAALVASSAQLAAGVIVCPQAVVSVDTALGEQVHVNVGSLVGHDTTIGAWSTVSPGCSISGNVRLGRGVFLGTAVSIAPMLEIVDDVVLGMGSVVVRPVLRAGTAFGNPAKLVRLHPGSEQIEAPEQLYVPEQL